MESSKYHSLVRQNNYQTIGNLSQAVLFQVDGKNMKDPPHENSPVIFF